jgi:hypothetical protein
MDGLEVTTDEQSNDPTEERAPAVGPMRAEANDEGGQGAMREGSERF